MKKIKKKNVALIALIVGYLYILSLFLLPFYLPNKNANVKVLRETEITQEESREIVNALKWHRFIPVGEEYFCTNGVKIKIDDLTFGIDFKGDGILYCEEKQRFLYLSKSKMQIIHNILEKHHINYIW